MLCPKCRTELKQQRNAYVGFQECPECGQCVLQLKAIRDHLTKDDSRFFWSEMIDTPTDDHICPHCDNPMQGNPLSFEQRRIVPPTEPTGIFLHICRNCQLISFNVSDFDRLPLLPPQEKKMKNVGRQAASSETQDKLARALLTADRQTRPNEELAEELQEDPKNWLPALFGLPVKTHQHEEGEHFAWACGILALLIVGVSVATLLTNPSQIIDQFGLIPNEMFRLGGLTLVTNFFLHGGWVHLIGNVYFLLLFGLSVNRAIGTVRFLLLVAAATFAGDILHILTCLITDRGMSTPSIGASGGISGVIIFYALRFPHSRIHFWLWWSNLHGIFKHVPHAGSWVTLHAEAAFIAWILYQVFLYYRQAFGSTDVSAAAHIGGIATGAALFYYFKRGEGE